MSNYLYVQDATAQKIIQWGVHPHLKRLIDLVQKWVETVPREPLYVIIFKARQVYTTTTIAAISNWLCTFFESTRIFESSQREDDANEILGKSRFYNDNHPDFLKLKLSPDQSSLIGFPATHSRIRALPATAGAGRSTDATMVFADEWEYHSEAERNFAAVKPTIDKGGIFIGASTVDKTNMDSFPKKIWREAKSKENNFIPLFWDYFSVPNRNDDTWYEHTKGLADWQKEGEYPRSEEEAMSAPASTCYFNRDSLGEMLKECREPIEKRYGEAIRIYAKPVIDRKYIFAIDSSEGQDDPMAGVISDWRTEQDVVAVHGKLSVEQQAKMCFEVWEEYNHPFTAVENNGSGSLLIEKLKNMGVNTWYYQDKSKKKEGWHTSGTGTGGGTRPIMLSDLAENISNRHLGIPMREAVHEFLSFSWIDGKPQAIRGAHDDWVMAHAILCQIRKRAPVGNFKVTSFKYKES